MLQHTHQYFTDKFTPLIRNLHYFILFFVLFQIAISNVMELTNDDTISNNIVEYYATWAHIIVGLILFLLIVIFIIVELSTQGFSYFYPYVSGDITQLKRDIIQLKLFKLPELAPKGLAAIIQGLGLISAFLVALSGVLWFILWLFNSPLTHNIQEMHELFTGLIEAYIVAHGSMGILHLFIHYKTTTLNKR